jgi:ABC-type uncharacterized transport system permease subunit
MLNILEALPLSVFLISLKFIDKADPGAWEAPFVLSGLSALAIIFVFFYKKLVLNRIFLGINLYLISGGLAIITHQWWVNRIRFPSGLRPSDLGCLRWGNINAD